MPVCPSLLVAVTVYLCAPVVEVSSEPLVPVPPLLSAHELIPGPGSAQLNWVETFWFWL